MIERYFVEYQEEGAQPKDFDRMIFAEIYADRVGGKVYERVVDEIAFDKLGRIERVKYKNVLRYEAPMNRSTS